MKSSLGVAFAVYLLCVTPVVFAAQDQDSSLIDSFIASQARKQGGEEYKQARKTLVGDVNRDGIPDAVILFTIEGQHGSNNYVQNLAVFLRAKDALIPVAHTEVGGKSHRSVELTAIDANGIHLKTMKYAPRDATCCPSIKGMTRYKLMGGKLREQ